MPMYAEDHWARFRHVSKLQVSHYSENDIHHRPRIVNENITELFSTIGDKLSFIGSAKQFVDYSNSLVLILT
jgi:hypothetical protein